MGLPGGGGFGPSNSEVPALCPWHYMDPGLLPNRTGCGQIWVQPTGNSLQGPHTTLRYTNIVQENALTKGHVIFFFFFCKKSFIKDFPFVSVLRTMSILQFNHSFSKCFPGLRLLGSVDTMANKITPSLMGLLF